MYLSICLSAERTISLARRSSLVAHSLTAVSSSVDFFRNAGFRHGVALFNRGRYFDAHEALEDVWRPSAGEPRRCLQGLVQVAVALHHASRGNRAGATSVLARALRNLHPYPEHFGGVALDRLC